MLITAPLLLPLAFVSPAPAAPSSIAIVVDEVDDWIAEGRRLLDEGAAEEAEAIFERAANKRDTWKTRMWVIRSWIAQERVNDSLNAIDSLRDDGAEGPDLDYLYGMAFAAGAQKKINEGVSDTSVLMNAESGAEHLARCCAADAERYRDAFLPLAFANWYAGNLDASLEAAQAAVRHYPEKPAGRFQVANTSWSLWGAVASDESKAEEAAAHLARAVEALNKTIELYGEPEEWTGRRNLSKAAELLCHAQAVSGDTDAAIDALAIACEWDPTSVNYQRAWEFAGADACRVALDRGAAAFAERFGEREQGDATLLWWLGYLCWSTAVQGEDEFEQRLTDGEAAFEKAVAKWPAYTNSWYWIFRCRIARAAPAEAIDALREYWTVSPDGLVSELSGDVTLHRDQIDWACGMQFLENELADCVFAYEVITRLEPDRIWNWSFLAQFLRDQGDVLFRRTPRGEREAVLPRCKELWERSWETYQYALSIEPENPALLNDGAVVLHYNLERDYETAEAMYIRAAENAEAMLADPDVEEERVPFYETALRDSRNNLPMLRAKMEAIERANAGSGE